MIVIFDLDGTICDIAHRLHHWSDRPRRWAQFYQECVNDTPITPVVDTLRSLKKSGHIIHIATARSDEVIAETKAWLKNHDIPWDELTMRHDGDTRPDDELKLSWIQEGLFPRERVLCVFEDRSRVVQMWREQGYHCFQVTEGNF